MAEINYPNQFIETGIWLLDKDALKEFDEILDTFEPRFQEQRAKDLEAECQKRRDNLPNHIYYKDWTPARREQELAAIPEAVAKSFASDTLTLKLTLESKRTVLINRFKDAANLPDLNHDAPREVSLHWRCGKIEIEIDLEHIGSSDRFMIRVSPISSDAAIECLMAFRNWSEKHRLHPAFDFWRGFVGAHLYLTMLAGLLLFAIAADSAESPGRQQLKAEARQIAQEGIKPGQEHRAMQVMLALQSGYEPEPPKPLLRRMPVWFWVAIAIVGAATVILFFPPRTAIAAGKGVAQVDWWRWWIKVTTYTIPSSAVTIILIPMVKGFFEKL